jgi:hypothetical protein
MVGRRWAQAKIGYLPNDVEVRGGPYSDAFSQWLADNNVEVGEHLRIDSMWVIENWHDCQIELKEIEENEPSRLDVLGVRGLRERVTEKRRLGARRQRRPQPRRELTPTELLQRHIDFLEFAIHKAGLIVEGDEEFGTGSLIEGNLQDYLFWQKELRDRRAKLAADLANLSAPETPSAPNGGDPGPMLADVREDGESS